ncbi:MAG: hypothetical protein ABUK01_01560 [Leptospirales bacterium]
MRDNNINCKSKSPVRMFYIFGALAVVIPICAVVYSLIAGSSSKQSIYETPVNPYNDGKPQFVYIVPSISGQISANVNVPVTVQISAAMPCTSIQSSIRIRGDLNFNGSTIKSSGVCENYTHDVTVNLPSEKTGFLIVDVEFVSINSATYQSSKAIYFSTIAGADTTAPVDELLETENGQKIIVIPVE